MKARKRTILFCASFGILGTSLAVVASVSSGLFKVNSAVKYAEKEVTLELNASNLTNGSGKVTLNGNSFTYENFGIADGLITLQAGSRIYADADSGASVGANGMRGSGFTNMSMTASSAGSATASLNGDTLPLELGAGETISQSLSVKAFDFSITAGSLVLTKMTLSYGCEYATAPETQKVLFVGSDNMSVTSWEESYTEALQAIEGKTASCDHFTTGSFSFLQIGNTVTDYAGKATEYREKLASNDWDAVIFQLSRRITPSATELIQKEFEMFRDVVVPITKEVTTNITLLAMEATANPTIFSYNPEDGQPLSTETKETKTVEEMTTFMEDTAVTWANATGVKVAKYGTVYNWCDTLSSNTGTKSGSRKYARGLMAYACINETQIPANIATTWVSTVWTSDTSGARTLKNNVGAKVNEIVFG